MKDKVMQTMDFELVSPERRLVSEPVKMAVIPGQEGELGIGAGHASFVVLLQPGVVKLFQEGLDKPREIFIAGGFADITAEGCTILAEEAANVNEMSQEAIEQKIKDLSEDLGLAVEAVDKARIQKAILLEKAKLQAVTGKVIF